MKYLGDSQPLGGSMPRITASVVLYKTPDSILRRLIECIESSYSPVKLYIIDNSPTPDKMLSINSNLNYFWTGQNCGYGRAHNRALELIENESDIHFVLNPDIYFGPEVLSKIAEKLMGTKDLGLVMPKIVSPNGERQYLCKLLPNPLDLFSRRFFYGPLKRLFDRRNRRMEMRFADYNTEMEAPFLSGCFMALKTSVISEIGGFDDRFFMYTEDLDLSRRIHEKYRTLYWPQVAVVHDHQKASYKNLKMTWVHIESAIKYFNKWGWFFDRNRKRINLNVVKLALANSKAAVPPS